MLQLPTKETCVKTALYVQGNFAPRDIIHTTWDTATGAIQTYPFAPPHDFPLDIYNAPAAEYSASKLWHACHAFAATWEWHYNTV